MPVLFRLLIGVPLAFAVAVALFLGMRALIAMGDLPLTEQAETPVIDVHVRVVEHDPPKRTPPGPIGPVTPPPKVSIARPAPSGPTDAPAIIPAVLPTFDPPPIGHRVNLNIDRNLQPTVRIPASYPPQGLDRGIEGFCVLGFDVGPDGSPLNIQALSCTHAMFERPSIRAVERWKYAPKIVNGAPVLQPGVQTRMEFQLQN